MEQVIGGIFVALITGFLTLAGIFITSRSTQHEAKIKRDSEQQSVNVSSWEKFTAAQEHRMEAMAKQITRHEEQISDLMRRLSEQESKKHALVRHVYDFRREFRSDRERWPNVPALLEEDL